jgi:hypoxanthine-DNA glycosylase
MSFASELITHPFKPVFDSNCTKLILGTIPTQASRANSFYYGHPQNRFWICVAAVFDEDVPHTIEEKTALLLRHKIALWDVLAECGIKGAADSSINNPVANDFSKILHEAPIANIYANGNRAFNLYTKLCLSQTGINAIPLPSTSAANARCSLADLIQSYSCLR